MRSVVSKAFDQIRGGSVVRLFKSYRSDFADGQQQRDFLYVKDAVKITLTIATNPRAVGIFNVGSGEARTWLDLARAVFAALGKPPAIEFVDMPDTLKAKYQYHTRARTERLAEAGFCDPLHALEDGVADYVQRYLVDDRYLDPAVPEPGGPNPGAAGSYREPGGAIRQGRAGRPYSTPGFGRVFLRTSMHPCIGRHRCPNRFLLLFDPGGSRPMTLGSPYRPACSIPIRRHRRFRPDRRPRSPRSRTWSTRCTISRPPRRS